VKITEGYYFRLHDKTIFYAKGVIHPPNKVIGYPKYVLDPSGDRISINGVRYRKEPSFLGELDILRRNYNKYLVNDPYIGDIVPEIPYGDIETIYDPLEKARQIIYANPSDNVLKDVRDMIIDLVEATNVLSIGVSGSVLVGLHRSDSDIDIVIYGEEEGRKVYNYLVDIINRGGSPYTRYSEHTIKRVYSFRRKETPIDFHNYVLQAKRKVLEGFFKNREYFIRLVKNPKPYEDYGKVVYRKIGRATMKLKVLDAREAIYTPCRYVVEVVEYVDGVRADIDEVYSLRGRFNELAWEDEVILVRGTVEKLEYTGTRKIKYRLYLGHPGDFLVNLSLKGDKLRVL